MRQMHRDQEALESMDKLDDIKGKQICLHRRTALSLLILASIAGCSGGSTGNVHTSVYHGNDPYYGRQTYRRSPTRRARNRRRR